MKINLGCAKDIKEGWLNVDLHYQHPNVINEDVATMILPEKCASHIVAKDIIEHMPLEVSVKCLGKWFGWLQNGGEILLQTTNFDKMIKAYQCGVWPIPVLNHMLFAGVNYTDVGSQECDFHKSVYSEKFLTDLMKDIGYKIISVNLDSVDAQLINNPKSHNLNLTIRAARYD